MPRSSTTRFRYQPYPQRINNQNHHGKRILGYAVVDAMGNIVFFSKNRGTCTQYAVEHCADGLMIKNVCD